MTSEVKASASRPSEGTSSIDAVRPVRAVTLAEPLPQLAEFTAVLAQHVESSTLTANAKGTLAHQTQAPSPRSSLTRLSGEGDPEIVLRELLSRGGQGAVYLAEQTSLQRLVAVKVATGKDGTTDERRAASLLVEARVSGRLEHPNIVPVHIVGTGDDGQPLLVMKRVEGQTWRKLINAGRELERDVRILLDVCKALSLAHVHGIAHCDVKPGNVMIGVSGDVYLVDWGVAVGFGDNAPADIPVAKDVTSVFGTPKYLAPEMALPQGTIDQRTDIYVCGAVLHELVTGRALHEGTITEALLHAAHTAELPRYGDDVPDELAVLIRRAVARQPADRFQTIDAFRAALQLFLDHAPARTLCDEAESRLAQLVSHLENVDVGGDLTTAHRLFAECRFGFQLSLRIWPGGERAGRGLLRALTLMAEREIAERHEHAARALLAEMAAPPPALTEAVGRLAQKSVDDERAVAALQTFAREQDRRVSERDRGWFVFACGIGWCALMVALRLGDVSPARIAAVFSVFMGGAGIGLAVAGVALPQLRATAASRSLLTTMISCLAGLSLLHLVSWWASLEISVGLAMGHVLLAVTASTLASNDARLWPGVFCSWLCVPALFLADPLVVSGLGGIVVLTTIAVQWRRSAPPRV